MLKLNSKIAKVTSTAALGLALSGAVVTPSTSHAVIGIATVNPVLIGVGAGLIVLSLPIGLGGLFITDEICVAARAQDCPRKEIGSGLAVGTAYAAVAIVSGIVLLDNNGTPELSFTTLNEPDALRLGVSLDDLQLFNSHVSELNAIRESVQAEIVDLLNRKPSTSSQAVAELSQSLWSSSAQSLGPDADRVMAIAQKLSAEFVSAHLKK